MEHLPKAAVFAAVVRNGSFSGGARELGMARSTVSQHVRALEEAFGVRLLERTTRRMRLTQEGELLYERTTVALEAWEDARSAFAEARSEPRGKLRVTAPGGLATTLVAKVAGAYLREHPAVEFELLSDDRPLDLIADGIDLAVRMAPLADSTSIAKKLGASPKILVAHPSVAERIAGSVEEALKAHGYIAHAAVPHDHIELVGPEGSLRVPVRAVASANGAASQVALLESGLGLALMPELFVREAMRQRRLVRVFPQLAGTDLPIYALYPARRLMPTRVSRFLPRLEAGIRDVVGAPSPPSY